ncbi:chromate transporter [Devosia riboflavina]|uniref:Chromate transporter n=1 Tax=Devosia riboflavina TaxID=46914 RepID=A0A087LYJ0_9HYPH|nr:chromate efflux transporter [Devosia riboflavina]KFL29693.1 chromate transporter [Devosia riboflavina]
MTVETAGGTTPLTAPDHPSFAEVTAVFARIGLLSFGGPAGQIALMHKVLVEEKRWISETRFLHALNYCTLLPGPEAQQLATYIGWLLHGTKGGVVAGTLFIIPGFFVILALSASYALFQQADILTSLFYGIKAAVLAIVIEAVLRVSRRALRNGVMVALAAVAFIALFFFAVPFPLVLLAAGIVGYVGARQRPDLFAAGSHGGKAKSDIGPAVIDQNVPGVDPSWRRAVGVVAVWGSLWVLPWIGVGLVFGWGSSFASIYVFFSQMAVVTFGGAYAVLAYVAQEAVVTFGWLQPGEMIDGLALAETTPGPLVLVLTFVGFLAAYRDSLWLDPLLAGVLGAALTTWATFVPCFLWIFLGAPHIERLRNNKAVSGALAAITAAVVGVILNLAIWFGMHVVFNEVERVTWGQLNMALPVLPTIDWIALALCVLAGILVFRTRLDMLWTLALFGILGLAVGLLP